MKEIETEPDQEIILGINAANEIIKQRPHTVQKLFIFFDRSNQRVNKLTDLAITSDIEIVKVEKEFFTTHYPVENHQGVAILCNKRSQEGEEFLTNILTKKNKFLLVLDHMTDPHNVGACIRSAAAAGVDAVIVPKDRACHLTPTVRKVSSGASELIPFIIVTNLSRTLIKIRSYGIKVYGADQNTENNYNEINMSGDIAIVIGSENKGLKKLTAKNCDSLISISMPGNIESLNASVSAGILLFECVRQKNQNFSSQVL